MDAYMAVDMKMSVIQAGNIYKGNAVQERQLRVQACGTILRSRKIQHGKFAARLYHDSGPQSSVWKLSAHGLAGAMGFSRLNKLTDGKDRAKFGNRFGELSGRCFQALDKFSSNFKEPSGIRATTDYGANGSDEPPVENEDIGYSSVQDLPSHQKKMKSAATNLSDAFHNIMANAAKKFEDSLDYIKNSGTKETQQGEPAELETDWDQWQKIFVEVEEQENLVSVLKLQLQEAVEKEDFQEAAKLKNTLAAASVDDAVSKVMKELKRALTEERYDDVMNLRDKAGAGLVGWWVGQSKPRNDPYGHIIHISAAQGRFIAKSYTARQLATAGPGTPLFEVFVTKRGENKYSQQAVYLQHDGNVYSNHDILLGPSSRDMDISELNKVSPQVENEEKSQDSGFLDSNGGINDTLKMVEKIQMQDVKLKIFNVSIDKGRADDKLQDLQIDDALSGGSNNRKEHPEIPITPVVRKVMENNADDRALMAPMRVPAKLERKTKDLFLFNIDEVYQPGAWKSTIAQSETIWDHVMFEARKGNTADAFSSVNNTSNVLKEMVEMMRLAVKQTQRSRRLGKSTSFRQINDEEFDRLSGLYIGDFGAGKLEVVQIRRKFGQWREDESSPNFGNLEFYEYVEAVKLIGDLNIPSGEVIFRAKIGSESTRFTMSGTYAQQLGVIERYQGHGRLPSSSFRNLKWTDGELVLLKGGGHMNGAELGFVYSVPERDFLVLFNRLKLQN
ncbi:hypothetical protein R1flu_017282 [Riccia fluitans]|uniref:UVR domain-containing protein n=1 Tax=Riccia fluitans TaxID=41844 RepID=A0ABD1XEE5_9MARC